MKLFDGNAEAKKLDERILSHLLGNPTNKTLAIIQIGDNQSSEKYIHVKRKVGERLGIKVILSNFPAELSDLELVEKCRGIFDDPEVGGVIVQLPLPRQSLNEILELMPVEKDIDSLSGRGEEKMLKASFPRPSPIIRALEHFLYSSNHDSKKKDAIIVGGGKLVGFPVANYLKKSGWEVKIDENYSRGKHLDASLIVLSVGIPNLVAGDDIFEGSDVVDFGSSVVGGKTIGDLDMSSKLGHLNLVSPSPGGVGPLTVRYLFMNFLGI